MSSNNIQLNHASKHVKCTIDLASSKSESNRALIINALSGNKATLSRLANARDTETMQRLLSTESDTWDVLDAGTTMRFCTAFAAATGKKVLMTGTARMQERPIGILVDALRELGAEIEYQNKEGYPPHKILGFDDKTTVDNIKIRGDVSSQYISALLMIAPILPNGLTLELEGKVGSKPYILMTLNLMKHFGVTSEWNDNIIKVAHQKYSSNDYTIESDWSGASYWYSIAALADVAEIELLGLRKESNQGDSVLVELMEKLGVKSTFTDTGVILTKTEAEECLEWDFTHCPDIAQTISVVCAVKGISAKMTGLESLRIKETDRIDAIKEQLEKFGVQVEVVGDEEILINKPEFKLPEAPSIDTYDDHRMAMAFAPIALLCDLEIEDKSVVNKSYPDFWKDLEHAGFTVTDL